jgi:transcriptional regulator with GAF, ATPase, and Fis domain
MANEATHDDSVQHLEGSEPPLPGLVVVFSGGVPLLRTIALDKKKIVLGRNQPGLSSLADDRISRDHAEVSFDGTSWTLTDLGSRNGTFVDGGRIEGTTHHQNPRAIRAGNTVFVVMSDVRPYEGTGVDSGEAAVVGPWLREALDSVAQKARAGENLLITGESGTGKELAAKIFHASGPHSTGPFIAVNCAAIPASIAERLLFGAKRGAYSGATSDVDGYLQAAHRGVLFLDEVGELGMDVQGKLLRVLETKEVFPLGAARGTHVDLRICSATCRNLRSSVSNGKFRHDLYYRIAKPEVRLPPLRERREEIPWFIVRELRSLNKSLVAHGSLIEACLLRSWPGNVRELLSETRHAAQQALNANVTRVTSEHLNSSAGVLIEQDESSAVKPSLPATPVDQEPTREMIEKAIAEQNGNVAAAARALRLHRTQLYRLMKRWGIDAAGSQRS